MLLGGFVTLMNWATSRRKHADVSESVGFMRSTVTGAQSQILGVLKAQSAESIVLSK